MLRSANSSRVSSLGRPQTGRPLFRVAAPLASSGVVHAAPSRDIQQEPQEPRRHQWLSSAAFSASFASFLLQQASAAAAAEGVVQETPFQGVTASSLYVTLGLFVISVPGIWSQVKRAPKSKVVRKTFEVAGPAVEGAMPLDDRARQVFRYFKSYNYEVKGTGEVITFVGTYAAQRGQAAAVTFYTFFGLGSVALVLSILFPQVGNWWYSLTLLSPLSAAYYFQYGERQEEVKVKMATTDDEKATDIILEGDAEEVERFRKELNLMEKGKVYVKGILE